MERSGRQRVVVTGAGGQVGSEVCRELARRGHHVVALDHDTLDITDRESVRSAIFTAAPDAVVNAAAWTDVDGCEGDPERAFAANALAVRHLVEACRGVAAHLTHISTDYVFDGTKPEAYVEWDQTNPLSVYGKSKRGGELEIESAGISATVVRTSWVCGQVGHNLVRTVLRLATTLAEDPTCVLAFVDDQHGCPTLAADLAGPVAAMTIERRPGLFHVTNQDPTTWFGFVQEILRVLGHDPDRVRAITTADLDPPRPAPRPANSVLDNAAMRASGLELLPSWRVSLPALLDALRAR